MDKNNDAQLEKLLKDINLPEPDDNARKAAVNLSVAAFKEHQKEQDQKKNSTFFQGFPILSRLMGNSKETQRREDMDTTLEQKTKKPIFTTRRMATAMAVILVAGIGLNMATEQVDTSTINYVTPSQIQLNKLSLNQSASPSYADAIRSVNQQNVKTAQNTGGSTLPAPVSPSGRTQTSSATTQVMAQAEQNPLQRWRRLQQEAIQPEGLELADSNFMAESDLVSDKDAFPDWEEVQSEREVLEKKKAEQLRNNDKFKRFAQNPIILTEQQPVSTFSIDVDTASYSFARRSILKQGRLPHKDSVRIEEMINYFDYAYPAPESMDVPFKTTVNVTPSPWAEGKNLMHIGIKGYDIPAETKPQSNLVFLLDVSGSMSSPDKLPLVIQSMKMLLDNLNKDDFVSIFVYAGAAGVVLEPTPASERSTIYEALNNLKAGGSTAGGAGIDMAYKLAQQNFNEDGINRVILATDGDFNVGKRRNGELQSFIEEKRDSGIFLSVLGFGQGNLNDSLMQTLAQNGNGTAAYIDSEAEARKVLVEEAGSTLFTIAKDVKIQMEFNKDSVQEYRLVGYETRHLRNEDFDNDAIDAGDIGSGHTVTAIYEFLPNPEMEANTDFATLKMRYKRPDESASRLLTYSVSDKNKVDAINQAGIDYLNSVSDCEVTCGFTKASSDVQFSIAVAALGDKLKGGEYTENMTMMQIANLAGEGKGDDKFGYRAEFIEMLKKAKQLGLK